MLTIAAIMRLVKSFYISTLLMLTMIYCWLMLQQSGKYLLIIINLDTDKKGKSPSPCLPYVVSVKMFLPSPKQFPTITSDIGSLQVRVCCIYSNNKSCLVLVNLYFYTVQNLSNHHPQWGTTELDSRILKGFGWETFLSAKFCAF